MPLTSRTPALLNALALLALGGCGGQPAPTTSTLTGSIAQPSFTSPVKKITITNDKGQAATAVVGAQGEFSIPLEKGATYRLFLSNDGKSTPVILNSTDKGLVTTVHVKSGGASVNIGSVRFWPGDTASMTNIVANPGAKCVNGMVEGTSKPCAASAAAAQCTDDEEGDDASDDHSDGEQADDGATQGGGGEQVADPNQAMGVPEHSVAGDLGCGDGEGDDQEGD